MKHELAAVIDELLAGELSPGRRYEKLDMGDDLYSVRLSRSYRFVFLLYPEHDTALPVAVGPHDKAYRRALRARGRSAKDVGALGGAEGEKRLSHGPFPARRR